jgi:hypothetical protein
MNELFKDKLAIITNDDLLLKAIRAVFEEAIERGKPYVGESDDNTLLGEKYRSYEMAKQFLADGFMDLLSYRITKDQPKTFNKET